MNSFKLVQSMARNLRVVNQLKLEAQLNNAKQDPQNSFASQAQNNNQYTTQSNSFSMPYGDDVIFQDTKIKTENTRVDKDMNLIRESVLFEGDDPFADKVVERPQKGRVWGLEGELVKQKDVYFENFDSLTLDRLVGYLELNQVKDIVEHDLLSYNKNFPQRYGIVGTMYSSLHGWKVCKELLKSFLNLYNKEMREHQQRSIREGKKAMKSDNPGEINLRRIWAEGVGTYGKPAISGTKDDEWLCVYYREFMIHLFTEDARNEIDIEAKWMYSSNEETYQELQKLDVAMRSGKGGFFEPL